MKPHGRFSIQRHDRTLLIEIADCWNIEGYFGFVEAFRSAAQPLVHQPWGAIVDIREWGLATPEIELADTDLQAWTLMHKQRWRAFVSDKNVLKEGQVESNAASVKDTIETRFFSSAAGARAWFIELGLLQPESGPDR